MELQRENGKIDWDSLRRFAQQAATEDLKDEDEEVIHAVKQLARKIVNYCQDNPVDGTSHGQIAVRTQNCIITKLNEMVENQK